MLLDRVRRDTCPSWSASWCEHKDLAPFPEHSAHEGWEPFPNWSGSRVALAKHLHVSGEDMTFQISGS